MRDLIVNGVPLRDPLGMWFIDYTRSSLFSTVSRQTTSDSQIGYHGVDSAGTNFFGATQDTLVLNLQATTPALFNQAYRALVALFMQPSYQIVSAPQKTPLAAPGAGAGDRYGRTFNVAASVLQVATARTIGSIATERINAKAARLTIILERPSAFWGSPDYYTSADFAAAAGTVTAVLPLAVVGESTAPITDGLLRIKGPISAGGSIIIRDRGDTRKTLTVKPSTPMTATQYILVDMGTLRARLQTSAGWDITAGTDARGSIEVVSDGAFSLDPDMGLSSLTTFPPSPVVYFFTINRVGSDAAVVATRIRRSYLS